MGGWASTKTQNTKLTPEIIRQSLSILKQFESSFNRYLRLNQIETIKISSPVGSGAYYLRDLESHPEKEYGDIDVHMIIPRIVGLSSHQNKEFFYTKIAEFCKTTNRFESHGKGVFLALGDCKFVQVDLIAIFSEHAQWAQVLTPEYGTKGVLCSTLYTSLAETLMMSFSEEGVRAKIKDGQRVPFNIRSGTTTHTVTIDPRQWGIDIVKYLNGNTISTRLNNYPGMKSEIQVTDIVETIKGIAESLEMSRQLPTKFLTKEDFLESVKNNYLARIESRIQSSKFDKAETDEAKQKVDALKNMLYTRSNEIAGLLI